MLYGRSGGRNFGRSAIGGIGGFIGTAKTLRGGPTSKTQKQFAGNAAFGGLKMVIKQNKILINPTYRCQLDCPYCDYKVSTKESAELGYPQIKAFEKMPRIKKELTATQWHTHLNKFRPYLLEVSGGEPTQYFDIIELLDRVPADSRWAMTSNTLRHDVIEKIDFSKCISWTSSYHHRFDELFFQGLETVKSKWGRYPAVTLVLTKENLDKAMPKVFDFVKRGIPTNVHPYFGVGFDYHTAPELKGFIDTIKPFVHFVDCDWVNNTRFPVCRAGHNYFYAMPDGTLLRCYSHGFEGLVMGHISEVVPNEGLSECNVDCRFPCDREIAQSPTVLRN